MPEPAVLSQGAVREGTRGGVGRLALGVSQAADAIGIGRAEARLNERLAG